MMVDEADSLGLTDVGNPSQKNKKLNPNQRRRGPLPKDFILLEQNSWRRSPTPSPLSSPIGSPRSGSGEQTELRTSPEQQNGSSTTTPADAITPVLTTNNVQQPLSTPPQSDSVRPNEQDLALRSDIFKHIRGPGMNYAIVLKKISNLEGEKGKFILEETIREAKRFKKVKLLHQLNLINRQ